MAVKKNIVIVPDIIANAGGVIASMEEYASSLSAIKARKENVFKIIAEKLENSFELALELSRKTKISLVEAALQIAMERVHQSMINRRYFT